MQGKDLSCWHAFSSSDVHIEYIDMIQLQAIFKTTDICKYDAILA